MSPEPRPAAAAPWIVERDAAWHVDAFSHRYDEIVHVGGVDTDLQEGGFECTSLFGPIGPANRSLDGVDPRVNVRDAKTSVRVDVDDPCGPSVRLEQAETEESARSRRARCVQERARNGERPPAPHPDFEIVDVGVLDPDRLRLFVVSGRWIARAQQLFAPVRRTGIRRTSQRIRFGAHDAAPGHAEYTQPPPIVECRSSAISGLPFRFLSNAR
jgi:hypothetical protein